MNRMVKDDDLLRWSMAFVWLATAVVSVWELNGQSMDLLAGTAVGGSTLAPVLILSGAGLDAMLGCAIGWRPSRSVYVAALLLMLLMTVVATALLPGLWLHPLGPLTKNVPIAAVLLVLARRGG